MAESESLPNELHKFCRHSHRLGQILKDTRKYFEEINEKGLYEGDQIVTAELLREEENEITSVINRPATIVVFGQTSYAKFRIVNEIFKKSIFPEIAEDDKTPFRMVRFKHGETASVSLTLPDDYDLVDNLEAYNGPWVTIPRQDLEFGSPNDMASELAVLDVSLTHPLLRFGAHLVVSPSEQNRNTMSMKDLFEKCLENATPILLYSFSTPTLSQQDLEDLKELGAHTALQPIFFVRVPPPGSKQVDTNPPDGGPGLMYQPRPGSQPGSPLAGHGAAGRGEREAGLTAMPVPVVENGTISEQLAQLQLLPGNMPQDSGSLRRWLTSDYYEVDGILVSRFAEFHPLFLLFTRNVLRRYLVNASGVLNNAHTRCLNMFIISAFDMARDVLITPKKLKFVKEKEEELFKSLMQISVSKIDEIKNIIAETINTMKDVLIAQSVEYDFIGVDMDGDGRVATAMDLKICTRQVQELVLSRLNQSVAGQIVSSVNVLRDSYTGTLTRCLQSLEGMNQDGDACAKTTDALKQILNAAYQVEITVQSSSSFLQNLLKKMKQAVQSMPWNTPPTIDSEWKQKVAADTLSSLSEARLARSISGQIKERLNKSHEAFLAALRQLEQRHHGRLDAIETQREKLRKIHAPKVARLALESVSLKDVVLYGMPKFGREIGRGQYGVVYSCESWDGHSPCAIKSVVPPDDKHWNDLAMEFFYTKNIPEHKRIVSLRGSVVDYMYGGGTSPAVLLVMDRLQRDLYTAIKQGLDWNSRLQVAIDVVEGIRFLHNQGLVHRDIKLKNVLLDRENRGKITDLGFCKPGAMMSGSIVGTPIHMAPELFSGKYDNSVDVYAFGILFWYVCAGNTRLPNTFEQCANKDHLWQSVKKGLRPEKLPTFDEECWTLMQQCWAGESSQRPHLGDVEAQLISIRQRFSSNSTSGSTSRPRNSSRSRNIRHQSPVK